MEPNNNGDRITNGHLLSANKASSTRFGLHIIELLAKGAPWESPNNQSVALHKLTANPTGEDNTYIAH